MKQQKSFKQDDASGILYLVPTPIGNLEDMTFRAIRTLKEVSLIASEDTRNTQKLLNHFEIKNKQISLHEHNYKERVPELVKSLLEGESIAQVSDAGMPSISDPGHELVVACIEADISVVALPGATAGLTALIASGLPSDKFLFFGFLPKKKNKQIETLTKLESVNETIIFYESPYRMKQTLMNMVTVFGENRKVVICRELTKIYEEYLRGSLSELVDYLSETPIKGECCLLLEGNSEQSDFKGNEDWLTLSVVEHVAKIMEVEECASKEAIKKVAKIRGIKKQEVYSSYHGNK